MGLYVLLCGNLPQGRFRWGVVEKKNKKKLKKIANIMAVVKENTLDGNPIVISTSWHF